MKTTIYILFVIGFLFACHPTKTIKTTDNTKTNLAKNDTINIVNDEIEYQIIIIEPGFGAWLASIAKPEGFYSQNYLETRNMLMVTEWNIRASQPMAYNPNLYEMQIDYQNGIDYGYEVNYKLYNYFVYFQQKYKQKLGVGTPRI